MIVEKFHYYTSGFSVLQKIEPLNLAHNSRYIHPIRLKIFGHVAYEVWNNFGIQFIG
jgi:hypothetical protein